AVPTRRALRAVPTRRALRPRGRIRTGRPEAAKRNATGAAEERTRTRSGARAVVSAAGAVGTRLGGAPTGPAGAVRGRAVRVAAARMRQGVVALEGNRTPRSLPGACPLGPAAWPAVRQILVRAEWSRRDAVLPASHRRAVVVS